MSKKTLQAIQSISLKQARQLFLSSQGFTAPLKSPLQIIKQLGYVQIDTISVVERAHHHVFWSRNSNYRPSDLDNLVKSRKVFEYWSHAASFLPMRDYRYTKPMKAAFSKTRGAWHPRDPKLMKSVLDRIRTEGPLRSKDFKETKQKNTGWWDWKPAKKALERLFLEGQLEVSHRDGFQKVYDLPERVIPSSVDTSMPSDQDYTRFLIERCLRHHGLATVNEIAYLQKSTVKTKVVKELEKMTQKGKVVHVKVKGLNEGYYALAKTLEETPKTTSNILILSPFDNSIIQRKKASSLFSFDYQIECYVPEAKRKYGYFSLPIFKGTKPLARIDCKANRKEEVLEVQSLHFEAGVNKSFELQKIKERLTIFAKFNRCSSVRFMK